MIHINCGSIVFSYGSELALKQDLVARIQRIDALESSKLPHAPAELERQRAHLEMILGARPLANLDKAA